MDDSNNDGNVDELEDDIEWQQRRHDRGGGCLSQNFAINYIFYWMEVDANDIDGASLLPPSSSSL